MSSIRLHRKYGVNPTVAVCWWCGKDTGEVVLLGASYQGEAPHRMVVHREPCPACVENMKKGITLIEAVNQEEPEPTGRWCVITEDAARRAFTSDMFDRMLQARKAYLNPEIWRILGLPTKE